MKTKLFALSILMMLALGNIVIMSVKANDLNFQNIRLPDEPVTMIAYDGDVSYFDFYLSDIPSGLDVANGSYMGWCADRSVVMPRGEKLTMRFYNSYDLLLPLPLREKNWGKVNYILNHKGDATKQDIQDAFWFFLCDYPYESITSTAQMLVDTAQDGFIPQPDELIAILAEPIHNDSNPWPIQFAFLQVRLPPQEPTEDEEPIQPPTTHSHGLHYNDITPIANTNGPYNAISYQVIDFNGSASYDPDGLLIHFKWSFGDGTTAEGKTATHYYTHSGIYQIILTVTDNFGISDTNKTNATIIDPNRPPTDLIISGPINGTENTDYTYVIGAIDADHDSITYTIDWGDGTTNQTEYLPSGHYFDLLHQWNAPGAFTITASASDGNLTTASKKELIIHETLITSNIFIVGLTLLALIALLAVFLYAKKVKNNK